MAKFKTLSFCQNIFLCHQTSSCECSMCWHCACKVSDGFNKGSGTIWFLNTNKIVFKKQSVKKMAKFKMLSFCQKVILWHQPSWCKCSMCLHCVCKVSDGFSKSSVQVDFPVHALSEHSQTLIKKQSVKKMSKFKTLTICQKVFFMASNFFMQSSVCQHCACKVSDSFSQSSGTSWFPRACTVWVLTKPLLRSKVLKMAMFKMLSFCQKVHVILSALSEY